MFAIATFFIEIYHNKLAEYSPKSRERDERDVMFLSLVIAPNASFAKLIKDSELRLNAMETVGMALRNGNMIRDMRHNYVVQVGNSVA